MVVINYDVTYSGFYILPNTALLAHHPGLLTPALIT